MTRYGSTLVLRGRRLWRWRAVLFVDLRPRPALALEAYRDEDGEARLRLYLLVGAEVAFYRCLTRRERRRRDEQLVESLCSEASTWLQGQRST